METHNLRSFGSNNPSSPRTIAAKALNLMVDFLIRTTATPFGLTAHRCLLMSNIRWKLSAPASAPSSRSCVAAAVCAAATSTTATAAWNRTRRAGGASRSLWTATSTGRTKAGVNGKSCVGGLRAIRQGGDGVLVGRWGSCGGVGGAARMRAWRMWAPWRLGGVGVREMRRGCRTGN